MGDYIMLNRRTFLRKTLLAGAGLYALPLFAKSGVEQITILHTNDLHCHLEPFSTTDPKYPDRGGMKRISAYVKHLRKLDPELLFFDSGDFSQGTPYYNFFKGELVLKLMSQMGYNASTIGNHEFDFGLGNFKEMIQQHAQFQLVSSNYGFENTPLNKLVKKYVVFERKGLRIGVYGLGIELDGLVGKSLYGNTIYSNPVEVARQTEEYLHNTEKCNLIICLSHLGYRYNNDKICDITIAENTVYTDAILGGHTHTFLDTPVEITNKQNMPVVINQAGWASLMLGRIDFYFEKHKKIFIDLIPNKNIR